MKNFTPLMKVLLSISFLILLLPELFAQSVPQGMKYQAVARDNKGEVISEQQISLRIILQSDLNLQEIYYVERHTVTTNQFGLFSLVVGEGNVEKGIFSEIPWSTKNIWMGIEIKSEGEPGFTSLSNSKLLAVPYAFHAATASELISKNANDDKSGVPANVWSLFGNSNTDPVMFDSIPNKDKFGTTDYNDLVFITNDSVRMRITADGDILMGNLVVDSLTVNYTAKLNVKGGYTVNYGDFTVDSLSSTLLTGTLTVDEETQLNDNLNVSGKTNLDSTLTVDGVAVFYKEINAYGQTAINVPLTGPSTDYDAYPLWVRGANQGVAIQVNSGTPDISNNFLTFFDNGFNIRGRIEGQTLSELQSSPEYIFAIVWAGLDIVFPYAESIAAAAQADVFEVISNILQGASESVKLVQLVYNLETNVGIAFESGSGDYAEWLERENPNENYEYGEIVGVYGGKISKNTNDAHHIMVISKSPIVLGNMPPEDKVADYEKVAFMGQVVAKVAGKVRIGDYILPSGNNDGVGIAVKRNKMKPADYKNIVGVAWSNSGNDLFNYINIAVGINSNEIANALADQQEEIRELQNKVDHIMALLNGENKNKEEYVNIKKQNNNSQVDKSQEPVKQIRVSDEQFEKWINEYGSLIEARFKILKAYFDENKINYRIYPEVTRIVDNPIQALRDMREDKFMPSVWQKLEQKYFDEKK